MDELGIIETTAFDAVQDAFDAWLEDLNANDPVTTLVIANRIYDLPWDDPERSLIQVDSGNIVTRCQTDRMIATQRRRLGR